MSQTAYLTFSLALISIYTVLIVFNNQSPWKYRSMEPDWGSLTILRSQTNGLAKLLSTVISILAPLLPLYQSKNIS